MRLAFFTLDLLRFAHDLSVQCEYFHQIFLLKTDGLVGVDKAALKKEVLDVVTQRGGIHRSPLERRMQPADRKRPKRTCCTGRFLTLHLTCMPLCSDLAPIYEHLCALLGWPVDAAQLASMQEKNAAKLAELDAKIKDAEENMGEQEVCARP